MKTISLLMLTISLFLMPIQGLLFTMILFIVSDTIFGVYVAIKKNGIESFKSTKFFNIVVKSFFYLSTIIMSFFLDKYIFESKFMGVPFFWAKAMTVVWCYTEVKSIDESSMKLGNRSFWVILKEFIDKLKGLKKDLNEIKSENNGE